MPARLICVRHAESEGNAARSFTRTNHAPLTARGETQARRAAERIRARFAPRCVIASPYRRAHDTARIIATALRTSCEIEHELREQFMGGLHGQPYEAALASPGWKELPRWEWRPPGGGETLLEVQARALPAVRRIARAHPADDVVLVSHAGTLHSLWAHAAGGWEHTHGIPNGGLLVIPHDGERFHAAELLATES